MSQIGNLPQVSGENKKYWKPPPRSEYDTSYWIVLGFILTHSRNVMKVRGWSWKSHLRFIHIPKGHILVWKFTCFVLKAWHINDMRHGDTRIDKHYSVLCFSVQGHWVRSMLAPFLPMNVIPPGALLVRSGNSIVGTRAIQSWKSHIFLHLLSQTVKILRKRPFCWSLNKSSTDYQKKWTIRTVKLECRIEHDQPHCDDHGY